MSKQMSFECILNFFSPKSCSIKISLHKTESNLTFWISANEITTSKQYRFDMPMKWHSANSNHKIVCTQGIRVYWTLSFNERVNTKRSRQVAVWLSETEKYSLQMHWTLFAVISLSDNSVSVVCSLSRCIVSGSAAALILLFSSFVVSATATFVVNMNSVTSTRTLSNILPESEAHDLLAIKKEKKEKRTHAIK